MPRAVAYTLILASLVAAPTWAQVGIDPGPAAPNSQSKKLPPSPPSFFEDYYRHTLEDGNASWNYFGGKDDVRGGSGIWALFPEERPSDMDSRTQIRKLSELSYLAEKRPAQDGYLFFKLRLFSEMRDLAFEQRVDEAMLNLSTCGGGAKPPPPREFFSSRPMSSRAMYGGSFGGRSVQRAPLLDDDKSLLVSAIQRLCQSLADEIDTDFHDANADLVKRYEELAKQTDAFAGFAEELVHAENGVSLLSLQERVAAMPDHPYVGQVLDWYEELKTLQIVAENRSGHRPQWNSNEYPINHFGSLRNDDLIGCQSRLDTRSIGVGPNSSLDQWMVINNGRIAFWDMELSPAVRIVFENPPFAETAARIGVALLASAQDSVKKNNNLNLFREKAVSEDNPVTEVSPCEVGKPCDPQERKYVEHFSYTDYTSNPWRIDQMLGATTLSAETIAKDFGSVFATAVIAFRNVLRDRILAYASPTDRKLDNSDFTFGKVEFAANVTESPFNNEKKSGGTTIRFKWMDTNHNRAFENHFKAQARVLAMKALVTQLDANLTELASPSGWPTRPEFRFGLRLAESFKACVTPYLPVGQNKAYDDEILAHFTRYQEVALDEFRAAARSHCASANRGSNFPLLENQVNGFVKRMIPGESSGSMNKFIQNLHLAQVCQGDRPDETVMSRFLSVLEVASAVFTFENFAAGGYDQLPHDPGVIRSIGGESLVSVRPPVEQDQDSIDPRQPSGMKNPGWAPKVGVNRLPPSFRALDPWESKYIDAAGNRVYPASPETAGWRDLSAFLSDQSGARRFLFSGGVKEFKAQVFFSNHLKNEELFREGLMLDDRAEAFGWERRFSEAAGSTYRIYWKAPGSPKMINFDLTVPNHPHKVGDWTLYEARDYATSLFNISE